jgi:DNA-binding winged helix-turn-helix (wHTH) protein
VRTRFGTFTLDSHTRQLLDGGQPVHLSPKAFDVLTLLVEARPAVVNKADLHDRIWPGTFVVDANLSVLIGEIRRAIGDSAQTPRFIRTVHRVGYAFSAEASDGPAVATPQPADGAAARLDGAADGAARYWLAWDERRFMLAAGETLIGRNPECGIWLDVSGVSRRHARVRLDGVTGAAAIEDLNSMNGTFVNDVRIEGARPLGDGDVVQVASVPLTFHVWLPEKTRSTERIRRG